METHKMMTKFDYSEYQYLIDQMDSYDVNLVHIFDPWFPYGGCTVAWTPDSDTSKNKMIRVSVSYCSVKDQFSKKIGALHALRRMFSCEYIIVPVGDEDRAVVVDRLRAMFDPAAEYFVM